MEAGQTIAGKYRLNRLIGTGGMATVWSAMNIFTEREFAIKFMLPQVARTPEAARRFLLEAKVSARINHPNIIEVIDVGQAEDGSLFLVMELLTGQSLDVAIHRQSPPMALFEFAAIMLDVAKALAAAHKSGVVHRDLKPTNIFLHKDREGNAVAKILDFGVSKILEEEKSTSLTIAGTVLGSPLYMSPEQAMGAPGIDGRTDIFAFGSILFEALSGRRAFDGVNFNALIVAIATQQPAKIDDCAPQTPESLRSLVRECLVTDKNQRIATFDIVVDRLGAALPDLASTHLRLASDVTGENLVADPDATNALPAVRHSDRVPASGPPSLQVTIPPASNPPRSGNGAVGPFSAALSAVSGGDKNLAVAVGAVGAITAVVIVVLVVAAFSRSGRSTSGVAAAGGSPAASSTVATPQASSAPSAMDIDQPPVVSIDQLPQAKSAKGRLAVAAGPGNCSLAVDGIKQGETPIASVAITSGSHKLECTTPSGRIYATTVSIQDGATTRYRFALDE
jgi:eukaryotic-like serine/threonine-protein kinase